MCSYLCVNDIYQRLIVDIIHDIFIADGEAAYDCFSCGGAKVRSRYHLFKLAQRVVPVQRFLLPYIQCSAPDFACLQGPRFSAASPITAPLASFTTMAFFFHEFELLFSPSYRGSEQ